MKNWENAILEELEIKETMYGGTKENDVDMIWTVNKQTYEAYDKTNKGS